MTMKTATRLLLLLLLSGFAYAQDNGMTIEEIDAWLAPNPAPYNVATSNDYYFAHFQTKVMLPNNIRGVIPNISFICTTPQMDITIPKNFAKIRGWPDDQDFTLRQFVQFYKELPNNKTICQVSACDYRPDGKKTRYGTLTSDSAMIWDKGLAPYVTFNDFLNISEARIYWESESE